MEKNRTIVFQIPEELFQHIKEVDFGAYVFTSSGAGITVKRRKQP